MENSVWVKKESNALNASQCLLKSHLNCLAIYIYFVLKSAQSSDKKKLKCDSEGLFERKLVVYFVLHYSRSRFFRKGFDPEVMLCTRLKPNGKFSGNLIE